MMASAQKQQENKGKTRFQGVRNEPRCSKTQGKQMVSSCQSAYFGSILGSLADREEIFSPISGAEEIFRNFLIEFSYCVFTIKSSTILILSEPCLQIIMKYIDIYYRYLYLYLYMFLYLCLYLYQHLDISNLYIYSYNISICISIIYIYNIIIYLILFY